MLNYYLDLGCRCHDRLHLNARILHGSVQILVRTNSIYTRFSSNFGTYKQHFYTVQFKFCTYKQHLYTVQFKFWYVQTAFLHGSVQILVRTNSIFTQFRSNSVTYKQHFYTVQFKFWHIQTENLRTKITAFLHSSAPILAHTNRKFWFVRAKIWTEPCKNAYVYVKWETHPITIICLHIYASVSLTYSFG